MRNIKQTIANYKLTNLLDEIHTWEDGTMELGPWLGPGPAFGLTCGLIRVSAMQTTPGTHWRVPDGHWTWNVETNTKNQHPSKFWDTCKTFPETPGRFQATHGIYPSSTPKSVFSFKKQFKHESWTKHQVFATILRS